MGKGERWRTRMVEESGRGDGRGREVGGGERWRMGVVEESDGGEW